MFSPPLKEQEQEEHSHNYKKPAAFAQCQGKEDFCRGSPDTRPLSRALGLHSLRDACTEK